jgi:hypothetical protein
MRTIEFYSDIYGLADTVPIVKPTDCLPKWVSVARMDYKQANKDNTHLYRCPGIFDLFTHGYIIPAWHDIKFETDGDHYRWEVPTKDLQDMKFNKDIASAHDHKNVAKHLPRPKWAHPGVLKLNTPWHVIAPKGVKLLITAVPYPDSYEFESLTGILDPAISTEINIQMNWNTPVGMGRINAGTPLAHIIPLTTEQLKLVVRDKNQHDEIWSLKRKFVNSMSYVLNRNRLRKLYEGHYHSKESKCPLHFWRK